MRIPIEHLWPLSPVPDALLLNDGRRVCRLHSENFGTKSLGISEELWAGSIQRSAVITALLRATCRVEDIAQHNHFQPRLIRPLIVKLL